MNETIAREEICRVGRSLFERGYVHATAGNISVKLDDGFLITPTDACLGFLDPAMIAKVDLAGQSVSGAKPSKTLALHQQIYTASQAAGQETRCVLHTHSSHSVALTLRNAPFPGLDGQAELLAPITPYFVMKVGHVPLLAYQRPGAPEVAQIAPTIIAAYAARGVVLHALMLNRLGPIVWHQTPGAAMASLEELEETAKLTMLQPLAPHLTSEEIDQLRKQFHASW